MKTAAHLSFLMTTFFVVLSSKNIALAQPIPTKPGVPVESPPPPVATTSVPTDSSTPPDPHAEAVVHYNKGRTLIEANDWAAAYAEFIEAMRIFPTRSASSSAAVCLKKLHRYDESLDLFEATLRDYSDLPVDVKMAAQREIVELRGLVGIIDIANAEVGASITVDGQFRGEFPLPSPIRVAAGAHLIRLYKEGFESLSVGVDVAGGSTTRAKGRLSRLVQSGKLRVDARGSEALNVFIDGTMVGKTPWDGPVGVGDHTVTLRGTDHIGTLPKSISIKANTKTSILLLAERLDAELHITPLPVDASIAVDGIFVGRGVWDGQLYPGKHIVKVVADGYFPTEQKVTIERGQRESLKSALKKDPSSAAWRAPGRFGIEAIGALSISPSLGGDVAGCTLCDPRTGIGGSGVANITYETWRGLGFGGSLGFVSINQTIADRSTTLNVVGRYLPDQGTVNDTLLLRALRVGVWGSYRFAGDRVPIRLRLGAGGLIGTLTDRRTGTFRQGGAAGPCSVSDPKCFDIGPLVETPVAAYMYIAPELRVGFRLSKHIELSAGVEALVLIGLHRPKWNDDGPSSNEDHAVNAADEYATFGSETLTGSVSVVVLPGVGIRYEF